VKKGVNELVGTGDTSLLTEEGITRLIHNTRQFVHTLVGTTRGARCQCSMITLLFAKADYDAPNRIGALG